MPLTKAQIKNQPIADSHVSPHFGDGGWHGSSFDSEKFDLDWQPLNDRILVKLLPETPNYSLIVRPENAAPPTDNRRGLVLRVGPGKRIEGSSERIPLDVKPGDEVLIGRWTDWDGFNGQTSICQEADIRVIVHGKTDRSRTKKASA